MSKIILLFKFFKYQGILQGLINFLKIKISLLNSIKLRDIEYPITLRKDSSDINTFIQIFIEQEYEIKIDIIPKVIVDCGANIGLFSILMKNKFPDVEIVCIEPDFENFSILKKNLQPYKRINYKNCGLWHKETRLKIFDKYQFGKWGMVVEEDKEYGTINTITVENIFNEFQFDRIDILKIDIETSEKNVFSENFENWISKVKIIIIELHDWLAPGCSQSFFYAIHKSIKNYKYFIVGENTIIINLDIL